MSKNSASWEKIFADLQILKHDFNNAPFVISAEQIKQCIKDFSKKFAFYANKILRTVSYTHLTLPTSDLV